MSETAASRLGGAGALATAGTKGKPAPSDKKETEAAIDAVMPQAAEEPRLAEMAEPPSQGEEAAPEGSGPNGAPPRGSELELKLLVDADELADFNKAPVIAAHARNKGVRKHLKSAYYDTAERTLRRNRLSLRVRQSGARYVQTVKTEAQDDPLRRGEWEASVASMVPDVALATPFIPEELRSEIESHELEQVFVADIRRHQRMVDLPSGTVEVAFDKGLLKAGERSMPVAEIELELKGGSPSAVYELALRLAEYGTVKPSIRSKSAASILPPTRRQRRENRKSSRLIPPLRWTMPLRSSCAPACSTFWKRCLLPRMAAIPKAFTSCASRCAACARRSI